MGVRVWASSVRVHVCMCDSQARSGHVVLLEYVEEYPIVLGSTGMASRIVTYAKGQAIQSFRCLRYVVVISYCSGPQIAKLQAPSRYACSRSGTSPS